MDNSDSRISLVCSHQSDIGLPQVAYLFSPIALSKQLAIVCGWCRCWAVSGLPGVASKFNDACRERKLFSAGRMASIDLPVTDNCKSNISIMIIILNSDLIYKHNIIGMCENKHARHFQTCRSRE